MAQVSLQINGYSYILGCADGQEDHLRALAADLDRRIGEIKTSSGASGEARLLLMAALVMSDELHDLRQQANGAEPPSPAKPEPRTARRLGRLAKRAETLAEEPPAQAEPETVAGEPGTDAENIAAPGDRA